MQRRKLDHNLPARRRGPTVLYVTVCAKNRLRVLDNDRMHEALRSAWLQASAWLVGPYVVMPDHVHILCMPVEPIPLVRWVQYWKRLVGEQLGIGLWQSGCWDHRVRDVSCFARYQEYMLDNPVRAELVSCADEWPYRGWVHRLEW
jgi:REP element-mobilizing transposase RayT